jgi:hypothetical protein
MRELRAAIEAGEFATRAARLVAERKRYNSPLSPEDSEEDRP